MRPEKCRNERCIRTERCRYADSVETSTEYTPCCMPACQFKLCQSARNLSLSMMDRLPGAFLPLRKSGLGHHANSDLRNASYRIAPIGNSEAFSFVVLGLNETWTEHEAPIFEKRVVCGRVG
jgi:hypothetical protein